MTDTYGTSRRDTHHAAAAAALSPRSARLRRPQGLLAILAFAALLSACGEAPLATAPTSTPVATATAQQAALRDLTYDVAVALADPAARRSVLADLHDASVNDHIVELRPYLAGARGRDLLNAMSAATGQPATRLLALVQSIRPLQLSMPVAAHRAAWDGGIDLYVASTIGRKDTPIAFTLAGEPVSLSARTPPETPTLGLVPIERLRPDPRLLVARPPSSLNARRIDAPPTGGAARFITCTGSEDCGCDPDAIYCDPCLNGCSAPPAPLPEKLPGIYMDRMIIRDAHEFWLRRSPEVDVILWGYVHGGWVFNGVVPSGSVYHPATPTYPAYYSPNYSQSFTWNPNLVRREYLACSGEAASGWRRFDFNDDGNNTPPWGQALLFEPEELALIETIKDPSYPYAIPHQRRVALDGPFEIEILERDDGSECPEPPHYLAFAGSAGYTFAYYMHTAKFNNSGWSWTDLASLFGNNNDRIAIFTFANAYQLQALNHTYLSGWDADLVLSSYNFNVANIPPSVDPYNP